MERIVYPFRRTFMHSTVIAGGIFTMLGSLPFFCGDIMFGSLLVMGLQSGELLQSSIEVLLAWLFWCGMCSVAPAFCAMGLGLILFAVIPYEAELTSTTFSFGRRGRPKTLQLAEITSVSVSFAWPGQFYPWKVIIKDLHQQQIQLPIARWATRKLSENIFDWRAMLRDILQRLPSTAMVDEHMKNFVATGKLPGAFWPLE